MRCDGVVRHRMGDPQRRRKVLSPNHQKPTTNCDSQVHMQVDRAVQRSGPTNL
jgi:hypothetical protein